MTVTQTTKSTKVRLGGQGGSVSVTTGVTLC